MLLDFQGWLYKSTDYKCVINNNELSDSLVIDVDSDQCIARFTVWDDQSCMSEIINVETNEYIINKRFEFNNLSELLAVFEGFRKLLN